LIPLLDKLPTILVLAVLVGIFVSLRKHSETKRIGFWIVAWSLIFLHFFVQIFETQAGGPELAVESLDIVALVLSGIAFVVSLMDDFSDQKRLYLCAALMGVPAALFAVGATFDVHYDPAMAAALALFFFGGAGYVVYAERKSPRVAGTLAAALFATGGYAIFHQLRGDSSVGMVSILASAFILCGFLYWLRFPRTSPGVLTVLGGFVAWGLVFPVATIAEAAYPAAHLNPELWNVPKFFVAFGMILTLVEEKSRIIEKAISREHSENALLLRFSRITSRLLSAKAPSTLCDEVAQSLTQASAFSRAAVLLSIDDGSLSLAGHSGLSTAVRSALIDNAVKWNASNTRKMRVTSSPLSGDARKNTAEGASTIGSEVVIPMMSSRNTILGFVWLFSTTDPSRLNPSELSKLEKLTADLSVITENSRLHHQLVRSDKLAALGQLVAGAAHELNNPLTGIIGYTELLSEEVKAEGPARRITKLGNEARRMKRIVDGLLHFARQSNAAPRAASLETALRDAIQLREYHIRKLQISVDTEIERLLPDVGIAEDQLKQVLLNLLSNAIDAVEESTEKAIRIAAWRQNAKIVILFEDSGPGFSDINRAFDPFFTTKPVGKGTGLGLSICYGIAREAGGDIHLSNREPYGASVSIELPVAQPGVVSGTGASESGVFQLPV
jgi:two-component system, NtrC family, sensor kinase